VNRSIRSRITAIFRKPLWRSAAILNFQQYDFSCDTKNRKNFLLVHVKFGENRSICCRSTAFLQIKYGGRPPSLIPHNANCGSNLRTGVAFCLCVSNFVRIGQSVPELQHSFEIQYGGRPPSWIPHNAIFEENLSTGVAFWLCVSTFVKIGQSVPELRHFFKIQYGGRPPSWIPNKANYEVTLKRAVIFWLCA
jgi:hypothetical protein